MDIQYLFRYPTLLFIQELRHRVDLYPCRSEKHSWAWRSCRQVCVTAPSTKDGICPCHRRAAYPEERKCKPKAGYEVVRCILDRLLALYTEEWQGYMLAGIISWQEDNFTAILASAKLLADFAVSQRNQIGSEPGLPPRRHVFMPATQS